MYIRYIANAYTAPLCVRRRRRRCRARTFQIFTHLYLLRFSDRTTSFVAVVFFVDTYTIYMYYIIIFTFWELVEVAVRFV